MRAHSRKARGGFGHPPLRLHAGCSQPRVPTGQWSVHTFFAPSNPALTPFQCTLIPGQQHQLFCMSYCCLTCKKHRLPKVVHFDPCIATSSSTCAWMAQFVYLSFTSITASSGLWPIHLKIHTCLMFNPALPTGTGGAEDHCFSWLCAIQ